MGKIKIFSFKFRGILTILLVCLLAVISYLFFFSQGDLNIFTQRDIARDKIQQANSKEECQIIINTYKRTLTLFVNGEKRKTFPVAIGKPSTKTPVGEWAIIGKSKGWGGGFGSRWLGLNVPWGIYGIHGTNKPGSIGSAASHGCIRMYNKHVEELYDLVPVKTRVKVIGKRLPIDVNRPLQPGQTGLAVMQLQDNLKREGFEPSYMDGRYGPSTQEAVKELEAQFRFKIDGRADWNIVYLVELPENKYYSPGH